MINTYDFKVSHPEMFKQLAVRDMLFVYYLCPQIDRQVQLFTHFNEIGFTLSGKKTLYHGGKSWTLTDDQAMFFRRTAYTQELHETAGWEVLAFYFSDDFLRQALQDFRDHLPLKNLPPPSKDMLIEIHVNETVRAFFYSMLPYFTQKIPPAENLLELKFKELLFNIFSDPNNAELLSYVNSLEYQTKVSIWEIMEANYMYNLRVADFARLAQRSESSFKREFQLYYHTTPGKWLTQKKLERARLLLETSSRTIGEVAYDSGFENISHFSRVFKDKYGTSPSQYRSNATNVQSHSDGQLGYART